MTSVYVNRLPAVTGSTSSVFTISRSVRVITTVGSESWLFDGLESVSRPVTVAVLFRLVVVEEFTRTVTVMVAVALFARLPSVPVRTPLATDTVP